MGLILLIMRKIGPNQAGMIDVATIIVVFIAIKLWT